MKLKIQDSATMMGLPEDVDMNALFANMTKLVGNLKEQLLKEID
jgi:hypothetical protein